MLPLLAWAVVTQYHRLGVLKNKHYFSQLGGRKSKIKVPADLVPGEGFFLGLLICNIAICKPRENSKILSQISPFFPFAYRVLNPGPHAC